MVEAVGAPDGNCTPSRFTVYNPFWFTVNDAVGAAKVMDDPLDVVVPVANNVVICVLVAAEMGCDVGVGVGGVTST